jgi:tetratricopeptide (TPR) repeat protein
MANPRLETLRQLLAQNPGDAFIRYGLAMEYVREGDLPAAIAEFRTLLEKHPDYVAAYYHCGQALEKTGDIEGARAVYQAGIDLCTRTGDTHTRSELQTALDMLG